MGARERGRQEATATLACMVQSRRLRPFPYQLQCFLSQCLTDVKTVSVQLVQQRLEG